MGSNFGESFAITRSSFRDQLHRGDVEHSLGGQFEWFWGVPSVLRALASPRTGEAVPAMPSDGDAHEQSLGYWAALHYLLLRRLAWSKPDQGLRWWYDHGKPTDDSTLALISAVWDADGALDVYLAWLLEGQPTFDLLSANNAADWSGRPPLPGPWRVWSADFHKSLRAARYPAFVLGGGWDPLHLTGHYGESGTKDPAAFLARVSERERTGVYVSETMDAWYLDLVDRGNSLPTIGIHSWKVGVFIKSAGYLGTYRRSMATGLWFTGRHRYHVVGN